jgi:hypothetical protein
MVCYSYVFFFCVFVFFAPLYFKVHICSGEYSDQLVVTSWQPMHLHGLDH